MPIHKPERVLLHHIPLKFVRTRVAGGGRKSVDSSIPLVPFIDFLITLVVFLITSFSATGELIAQKPSITMPKAANTVDLEMAPIISIDDRVVALDGSHVGDVPPLAASDEVKPMEPLIQKLETMKRNWSILHPSDPFPATVIMQADEKVDFRVLKKVMASVAQAGYVNMSFAVNKIGD